MDLISIEKISSKLLEARRQWLGVILSIQDIWRRLEVKTEKYRPKRILTD
jgi:hypothetical protein